MIVYTSGTTGASKGVLMSHRNILHGVIGTATIIGENTFWPGCTTSPLLPLFHIYGITGILLACYYGGSMCYSMNTLKDIERLIKAFKPGGLIAVPQIVEGLHKMIWASARKAGRQELLKKLLKLSSFLRKIKIDLRKIVFKDVLAPFGGNLIMICGGAAANDRIVAEMIELGIKVLVGFGITECAPIVSVNPTHKLKLGTVGIPLAEPFCSVKIEGGEILVRGSIVTSGYLNDPQGTKDAFDDGLWFKTGDLGRIDQDGYLYITGRKKNLIVLNDGNNISPEALEIRIRQSPIVDSVLVYEKKRKQAPVLLASIYPDFRYCSAHHISDIKEAAMELIHQVNKENPAYMKIFDVEIRNDPFEKTPTGKIKRYVFEDQLKTA
jgi:long-chain acyl-CoA synthetase